MRSGTTQTRVRESNQMAIHESELANQQQPVAMPHGNARARYVQHKSGCVSWAICLDGIRSVKCSQKNPAGGPPHRDCGEILYQDGYEMEVTLDCAKAVAEALVSHQE
ncbi:hypothetical protein GCM10023156_53080 [Novipirellula rosea]|uniref:Uncharacterized protein n=1 Tax=Novipirellula rosea TaxID=1031540 RepID=A0ABP8ND87_9BACT